jgi:Glycosyl hydrolase family 3 C-terminal domain
MFAAGVIDNPRQRSVVDPWAGLEVARKIEEGGIVLLKNAKGALPLSAKGLHTIAVIGAHSDVGMISGGGSAQVDPVGGNAIAPPGQGATHWQQEIWFPTSPAYFGAKVLHPATILPAVKKNIPVHVLNSRNAGCEGTRIISLAPHCKSPFKSIAVKKRLSIIDVVASRMLMTHGYMKEIFTIFDKHQCAVDMVSTSEVSVSLTVDSNDNLPAIAADLSKLADVKYEGRKALVCMVGEDIRGQNGMAAQVFNAIRHINVRMISQGASEINMSFMIDEDDADEAIRSLHAVFFKEPDPEIFDVEARK